MHRGVGKLQWIKSLRQRVSNSAIGLWPGLRAVIRPIGTHHVPVSEPAKQAARPRQWGQESKQKCKQLKNQLAVD